MFTAPLEGKLETIPMSRNRAFINFIMLQPHSEILRGP